jgi:hypothetical protein
MTQRRSLALPWVALLSNLLLLGSTVTMQDLGRKGFSSLAEVDSLAMVKFVARMLCLAFAVVLVVQFRLRWRELFRGGNRWLLGYFALALGTTLFSAVPVISATRAISFIVILFYGTAVVHAFARQRVLGAFWQGLYFCYGLFVVAVLFAALLFYRGGEDRLGGIYPANIAASIGGIAFVWSFVKLLRQGRGFVPLAFAAAGAAIILLAVSRGALIAAGAVCVLAAMRARRTIALAFVTALLVTGGALAIHHAWGGDPTKDVVKFLARGQQTADLVALTGRTPLYAFLLTEQFPRHPVLGVGFEMLSEQGMSPAGSVGIVLEGARASWEWHPTHAHNSLLSALIGTGLVGLALYVIGWWTIASRLWRLSHDGQWLGTEALYLLLFVLLHSLVDTVLSSTVDPAFIVASFCGGIAAVRAPTAVRRQVRVSLTPAEARVVSRQGSRLRAAL